MVALFFDWFYADAPRAYLNNGKAVTLALYNYFSLPLLLSTLFAPWRKDAVDMSRVPIRLWYQVFLNNTISRFIGFLVRMAVILAGAVVLFIMTLGLCLFLVVWYLMPLLMIASIVYGMSIIVRGGI